jgi:hypothetical protein
MILTPQNHFKIKLIFIAIGLAFLFPMLSEAQTPVSFKWDPNIEPDLAGYRIFHRMAGDGYTYSKPAWEGSETSCTIEIADEEGLHCFVARAFDTEGFESQDSDEICLELGYPPDGDSAEENPVDTGGGDSVEESPVDTGGGDSVEETPVDTGGGDSVEETPVDTGEGDSVEESPVDTGGGDSVEESPVDTSGGDSAEETPADTDGVNSGERAIDIDDENSSDGGYSCFVDCVRH